MPRRKDGERRRASHPQGGPAEAFFARHKAQRAEDRQSRILEVREDAENCEASATAAQNVRGREMSPLCRAELLCTIGRIIIRAAYVIGAVPAIVSIMALCLYFFGRAVLDHGNREWNDIHGIENPQMPTTAVAEAARLAKAWGVAERDILR